MEVTAVTYKSVGTAKVRGSRSSHIKLWAASPVQARGRARDVCDGDSVHFVRKNVGSLAEHHGRSKGATASLFPLLLHRTGQGDSHGSLSSNRGRPRLNVADSRGMSDSDWSLDGAQLVVDRDLPPETGNWPPQFLRIPADIFSAGCEIYCGKCKTRHRVKPYGALGNTFSGAGGGCSAKYALQSFARRFNGPVGRLNRFVSAPPTLDRPRALLGLMCPALEWPWRVRV